MDGEKVQACLTQEPCCHSGWLPLSLPESPGFLPWERQDLTLGRCVFLLTWSLLPLAYPSAPGRRHNPPAHQPASLMVTTQCRAWWPFDSRTQRNTESVSLGLTSVTAGGLGWRDRGAKCPSVNFLCVCARARVHGGVCVRPSKVHAPGSPLLPG